MSADNPDRLINSFVDKLHLQKLGFTKTIHSSEGRLSYAPALLSKLYLYGYLNKIRSRRKLERDVIFWLHVQFLDDAGLLGKTVVGIDGNKFKAVNSKKK